MQPNSQPSQADVNAVTQHMGGTPQPTQQVPQPPAQPQYQPPTQQPGQPQQPVPQYNGIQGAQPTYQQQPSPTSQQAQQNADPFANFQAPQQPVQPQPPVAQQGVEVSTPTPQAPQQPQAQPPVQPQQQTQEAPQQAQAQTPAQPGSYQEYVDNVLATLPEEPKVPSMSEIDANDPNAVQQWFQDWGKAIEDRAYARYERAAAVQRIETQAWEQAFKDYPSLRDNKTARDMVQSIRVGRYNMTGVYLSPAEAAQELSRMNGQNYQQGIIDSQTQSTITQQQPMNGGGQQLAPMSDKNAELTAVQDGGETALAQILANKINNGQL